MKRRIKSFDVIGTETKTTPKSMEEFDKMSNIRQKRYQDRIVKSYQEHTDRLGKKMKEEDDKRENRLETNVNELEFNVNIFAGDTLPNKNKPERTGMVDKSSLDHWKWNNCTTNERVVIDRSKVWFEKIIIPEWEEGIDKATKMMGEAMKSVMPIKRH